MKQTEEYFLSHKGIIDLDEIQYGKLNLIHAPCGSGKTTFVEKKLWEESYWGDLLYLIDSRNACEELNIRDDRGRLYKWPNVKKSLRFSDFRVTDKQEKNGRRYSVIEW